MPTHANVSGKRLCDRAPGNAKPTVSNPSAANAARIQRAGTSGEPRLAAAPAAPAVGGVRCPGIGTRIIAAIDGPYDEHPLGGTGATVFAEDVAIATFTVTGVPGVIAAGQ